MEKLARDVLIIEDDKDVSSILESYCQNMGCFRNIVIASDGHSAIQKLSNQKFAVILLDMNLPRKNGFQIIEEMASTSLNSNRSICVISGDLSAKTIKILAEMNVKHFILKPFNESVFQGKILRLLTN